MTHRYGIDTSVFVGLLNGEPDADKHKTMKAFEQRLETEPQAEFFVPNQVLGEAYIAHQGHFGITKADTKSAMCAVLDSELCPPQNGFSVLDALGENKG